MAEIDRGELLNCLMPFALYYERHIRPRMTDQTPANTPLFPNTELDGQFTINDFLAPWTIMQNDNQAKAVFAAIAGVPANF